MPPPVDPANTRPTYKSVAYLPFNTNNQNSCGNSYKIIKFFFHLRDKRNDYIYRIDL